MPVNFPFPLQSISFHAEGRILSPRAVGYGCAFPSSFNVSQNTPPSPPTSISAGLLTQAEWGTAEDSERFLGPRVIPPRPRGRETTLLLMKKTQDGRPRTCLLLGNLTQSSPWQKHCPCGGVGAACRPVIKIHDWDPEGWWLKTRVVICTAVNPTLLQGGIVLCLSQINCKSLWIKVSAKEQIIIIIISIMPEPVG